MLRLDYGYNVSTKTVNYHWNNAGTYGTFGIADHQPFKNQRLGAIAYKSAKYFRSGGRVFLLAGIAVDIADIAVASNPIRRATEAVSSWASAWAGCRVAGAAGAAAGSLASPLGTAIGGVGGCIIGGFIGYTAGGFVARNVYDWGSASFYRLSRVAAP